MAYDQYTYQYESRKYNPFITFSWINSPISA